MKRSSKKGASDWTDADYIASWKAKCEFNEQGCWVYRGYVHPSGYALVSYRGQQKRLHKLMYVLRHGVDVPPSWDVCHTCDIRNCINPLHLFAGHRMLNMQDMKAKGRCSKQKITHCPKGHPYEGDNLMLLPNGWRHCRTCHNERSRRRYHNAMYRKKHGISKNPKALQDSDPQRGAESR